MKKYRDHYFLRAKQENYPARSVYKLEEIDARLALLRPGYKVLDLGAAPGSWTLYAAERVGLSGRVLAVDLQDSGVSMPSNVAWFREDVFEPSAAFQAELEAWTPFDAVLSDMAPKTTGIKFTDQARSLNLALAALALAQGCLINGGHFAVKVFMGPDMEELTGAMRRSFREVKTMKPKSSRAESKEIFLVGMGFAAQRSTGDD